MWAQAATGDPNAVTVAVITAGGIVAVALISSIPAWFARRASNNLSAKVGEPNGRGNVMDILHALLDGQARQDERQARSDERLASLERANVETSAALGKLEGRVVGLERHHQGGLDG